MSDDLTYDALSHELLARFPDLAPGYSSLRTLRKDEEPGPHIVYDDVPTPQLIATLEGQRTGLSLPQAFALPELLANSTDAKVQEVVTVTVLERLNDRKEWRDSARTFMGPSTLRLSHDVERAWG